MKLKTLKDIVNEDWSKDGFYWADANELKQEAIKWVEEMVAGVKRNWVMHFFNISEKDLKGGLENGKTNKKN